MRRRHNSIGVVKMVKKLVQKYPQIRALSLWTDTFGDVTCSLALDKGADGWRWTNFLAKTRENPPENSPSRQENCPKRDMAEWEDMVE